MPADLGIARPNAADELARRERLDAASKRQPPVYNTAHNSLRKTAHEHSVRVSQLDMELGELRNERDELTLRIAEVSADRDRERKLYQAAALELDEAIKGDVA